MGVAYLTNMCSDIIIDDQNHTFSSVLSSLCDSHISRSSKSISMVNESIIH